MSMLLIGLGFWCLIGFWLSMFYCMVEYLHKDWRDILSSVLASICSSIFGPIALYYLFRRRHVKRY